MLKQVFYHWTELQSQHSGYVVQAGFELMNGQNKF